MRKGSQVGNAARVAGEVRLRKSRWGDGSEEVNTVWCEVGEEGRRQGSFWGRDLGRRIDNERALIRARVCVFLRSSKQLSLYVDAWVRAATQTLSP